MPPTSFPPYFLVVVNKLVKVKQIWLSFLWYWQGCPEITMYATLIVQEEVTGVTYMDTVTASVGRMALWNPHMVSSKADGHLGTDYHDDTTFSLFMGPMYGLLTLNLRLSEFYLDF